MAKKPKIVRPKDVAAFEEWAKYLRAVSRRPSGRKLPRQTAGGGLRYQAYRYYRLLKSDRKVEDLKAYLARPERKKWKHSTSDVGWVLRLVEPAGARAILTSSTRMRMTAELEFADRLDVPPALLLGFLHEAGGYEHINDIADDDHIPDFLRKYRMAAGQAPE